MDKIGKLIVIEGIDGSGKNTQTKLIEKLLVKKGFSVGTISFPDYQSFFGKEIGNYLDGKFGGIESLHPKLVALLYSNDRLLSKDKIENLLKTNDYVIIDRYVSSNLSHQTAKIKDTEQRNEMINWILQLEYTEYQLPKPNATIFLDIPPFFSSNLILKKEKRDYTSKKKDLHESNDSHLIAAYNTYIELLSKFENWYSIPCLKDESLRSADDISADLLDLILSI